MRQLFPRPAGHLRGVRAGTPVQLRGCRPPLCMTCSPKRLSRCAHCGADRPACARWPEGPVCEPCYRAALSRRGACQACGAEHRLVSPPGPGARLCAGCAGVAPLATCRSCGAEERPYLDGCCVRCALATRAAELIGGRRAAAARLRGHRGGTAALQRPQLAAPLGGSPPLGRSRLRPARPHPRGAGRPPPPPGRRLPTPPARRQRRAGPAR